MPLIVDLRNKNEENSNLCRKVNGQEHKKGTPIGGTKISSKLRTSRTEKVVYWKGKFRTLHAMCLGFSRRMLLFFAQSSEQCEHRGHSSSHPGTRSERSLSSTSDRLEFLRK